MANIDLCPVCGVNRLITGYSHRCIARPAPKAPSPPSASTTLVAKAVKLKRARVKPAEAKAQTTYRYRDADERRAYQRELMRKRRAKERKCVSLSPANGHLKWPFA
jgi:hypothetical protein